MTRTKTITIFRTNAGLLTTTENGGSDTDTGHATVVCAARGERREPLYVPRGYASGDHADFVVHPGQTHLVEAGHSRDGEWVSVWKIVAVTDSGEARAVLVGEWENGVDNMPPEFVMAMEAALEKSHCYHCQHVHFVDVGV